MILYVDATNRPESRTAELAEYLLENASGIIRTDLYENDLFRTTGDVLKLRDRAFMTGDFSDAYFDEAKRFASADTVVIAAPYWDLSFPAVLKEYIENICINGIAFRYDESGQVHGLCRAEKLYYVTTAGGSITDDSFGFGYIDSLARNMFGIKETVYIKAEMLDVYGSDAGAIIEDTKKKIVQL